MIGRRGPRIGPTPAETFVTLIDPAARIDAIENAVSGPGVPPGCAAPDSGPESALGCHVTCPGRHLGAVELCHALLT